jgi:YidC/Oxa1 family membrane protein insertase
LNVWELIIQQPLINILIVMAHYLGGSFGLAIIGLTILVNLCMLPLTLSQIRSSKRMQDLQPKLAELQKKYGKDRQKLAQEQMNLYKTSGVKPAGCFITMLIQMPVWIALYQSIMLAMAVAPEGLLNLARFLYPWNAVYAALPLSRDFLWLNMASPDIFLAILTGATQWVQQKMSMTPSTDPKQAQQSQMMLWMMPMMFGLLALSFPSGLALYWVVNNTFRIILQYRVSGWGGLRRQAKKPAEAEKKYLKFDASAERKPAEEEESAGTIVADTAPSQPMDKNSLKPGKSRFQPGKDRMKRRKK